jgi:hypothetical protein
MGPFSLSVLLRSLSHGAAAAGAHKTQLDLRRSPTHPPTPESRADTRVMHFSRMMQYTVLIGNCTCLGHRRASTYAQGRRPI